MDISRWSIPKSDITLFGAEDGETLQSAQTRLGADCGSDNELLITKFRLNLKKLGKTTRPFIYDLNQIPYDYTVEVRSRFECLKNYGQGYVTLCMKQGSRSSPPRKETQKGKMVA